MRLINFNFTKINVERLKEKADKITFNTKIDINSIDSFKSELKIKEDLLKIDFVYTVSYEPEFAKVELGGSFILSVEPKIAKEVLNGWKDKKTSEEFRVAIFNVIMKKSNIKALQLEDEIGLPIHVPMPSLSPQKKKEEKESQ